VRHALFQARREFDHASEAERGVMLRSRNRALAIYGLQVVRDITVAAGGVAKLRQQLRDCEAGRLL
jgi:hypothetical protein